MEYLEKSQRTQPDVTRRVISAVEQYGWRDVFHYPHIVASFELDEASLTWVVEQLERHDADGPDENVQRLLVRMLAGASPNAIAGNLSRIRDLRAVKQPRPSLHDRAESLLDVLRMRCDTWGRSFEECLELLYKHGRKSVDDDSDEGDSADDSYELTLIERIAQEPAAAADLAMEWLNVISQSDADEFQEWLGGAGILLAGQLRLQPAVPLLYRWFEKDWDWHNERVMTSLIGIGAPAVTAIVRDNYATSPEHVRFYATGILEAVHHDRSVADVWEILPQEEDSYHRGQLGVALASHFDTSGIEPALDVYRKI